MAKLEIGAAIAVVVAIGSSAGWNLERMERAKEGDLIIESRLTRVETELEGVNENLREIKTILREGYQ